MQYRLGVLASYMLHDLTDGDRSAVAQVHKSASAGHQIRKSGGVQQCRTHVCELVPLLALCRNLRRILSGGVISELGLHEVQCTYTSMVNR